MKFKIILITLLVGAPFLFLSGCFNAKPAEPAADFPETIGRWHKGGVAAEYLHMQNGGGKYPNFKVDYSAKPDRPIGSPVSTNDNQSIIRYTLGIHQNAEDAAAEQAAYGNCLTRGAWKTGVLNDRSAKPLGTMSICRNFKEGIASGDKNYVYSLIFSNENRLIKLEPLTATNQDLIEFTKALPFNSQADLAMIDDLSSLENLNGQKLMSLSPPAKITKEPYLKGKTVVLDKYEIQTGNYIADENRRAETVNEMQSLIRIKCEKGGKIGEYEIIETKEIVPAYGSQCKVTVIDHTIPAVIAEKTFINKEMPPYNTFYQSVEHMIGKEKLEYTAAPPQKEIKDFINALPIR